MSRLRNLVIRIAVPLILASTTLLLIGLGLLTSDAGLAVSVAAALLAGATLYYQLTGQRPLAPAPKLEVEIEVRGPGATLTDRGLPTMDGKRILATAVAHAKQAAPSPSPPSSPYSAFAGTTDLFDGMTKRQFERDLANYQRDLAEWLRDFEADIWPRAAEIELRIIVRNRSRAAAERVEVELRLPAELPPTSASPGPILNPPQQPKPSSNPLSQVTSPPNLGAALAKAIGGDSRNTAVIGRGDSWEWTFRAGAVHADADEVSAPEYVLPTGPWSIRAPLDSPCQHACEAIHRFSDGRDPTPNASASYDPNGASGDSSGSSRPKHK